MHSRFCLSQRRRFRLLGTASAAALLGLAAIPQAARADDPSDMHLWLDLQGQYSFNSGQKTNYAEPFDDNTNGFYPLVGVKNPGGFDGNAGLTLEDDDWFFNLAFNYGRTGTSHADFESNYTSGKYYSRAAGSVRHSESHAMLDFTVGRDVGLGMFGMEGTSVLSAGVRWANFEGTTIGDFAYAYGKYFDSIPHRFFGTDFSRELHRSFNGFGPVISWKGSTPFEGTDFSFEWGANGAVLFGHHHVRSISNSDFLSTNFSRGATVPQAGGYLGIGYVCPDFKPMKITAGYNIQSSWNVLPQNFDLDEEHRGVDRLTHGPFLRVTFQMQ